MPLAAAAIPPTLIPVRRSRSCSAGAGFGSRGAALRRSGQGRLGRQEEAPMNVEAILRSKGDRVATVSPRATIADAVTTLRREGIGALVASEDGVTVDGILSERDIIHGLAGLGTALLDAPV